MADGRKITDFTLLEALAAGDFIPIVKIGDTDNYRYDIHQLEQLILNKKFEIFDTIAQRDEYETGDQAFLCIVVDASADAEVDSGGALYAWKPGTPGEFKLLAKYGELDMAKLIAAAIDAADGKATLADADKIGIVDSADGNTLKKQTWAERKTQLEGLYELTDEKVKYDSADPTAGYVADKIIAGDGISVAEGTGASENKLVVTNDDKGSDVDLTGKMDKDPEAVVEDDLTDASVIQFWKVDAIKKITWTNIKATLKTYFESVWDFGHNIFSQTGVTKLTQRAKMRFKGFIKASDDSVEGETVVEIDETKTEVVKHIQQYRLTLVDKQADSGTGATAGNDTLDTGKTYTLNEHADKYAILTYDDSDREICKIASNTTAGVLTFTANRIRTDKTTAIDWKILEHHDFQGDEIPIIVGDITVQDYVIELPALEADNNGLPAKIHALESASATGGKAIWILPDGTDTINSESELRIKEKGRSIQLNQSFAGTDWNIITDSSQSKGDENTLNTSDGAGGWNEGGLKVTTLATGIVRVECKENSEYYIDISSDESAIRINSGGLIDIISEESLNLVGNDIILDTSNPSIEGAFTPSVDNHIANKKYVDKDLKYEVLDSNQNVTLDCANFRENVKAEWSINNDYTLTFDNVVAGQSGDIVIVVDGEREVTIVEDGSRTLSYADSETYSFIDDKITLAAGRYHLCFTAGSDWMDFNIQEYKRVTT